MQIKNLVFDIGNVLTDYRLTAFLAEKGLDGPMIKRVLKASIMSPYWEAFERDELDEAGALKAFASLDPEIEQELLIAYENVEGMLVKRDFATDWMKQLKAAGYGVYYLSNYSRKAYNECGDSLEFLNHVDGGLLSFQVGMTKPNPDFYKMLLEKYQLKAEECVFIDDTEENVLMAKSLGFAGIVFTSYEDCLAQLAAMGVK